jgi:endonuclease YncB( thermonuclease family)
MKRNGIKNKLILLFTTSFFLLASCSNNGGGDNTEDTKVSSIDNIFISELYVGSSLEDGVLELGSSSASEIALKGFTMNFYNSKSVEVSYKFEDEVISKNKLVIFETNTDVYAPDSVNTVINLDNDVIYGRNYIELLDSKGALIDCVGFKGLNVAYNNNHSMVRLAEKQVSTHTYEALNFAKVKSLTKTYIGNLNAPLSQEELLSGPRLDSSVYGSELYSNGDNPFGGYVNVSISSYVDGDTTYFKFPSEANVGTGTQKVRYLLIDTPEIDHGSGAEPYGDAAKKFTDDKLKSATSVIVQSNKNFALRENYERLLGYVWYTTDANKALSTYRLLNFELVLNGLAKFSTYKEYETMYYKDVLYFNYF